MENWLLDKILLIAYTSFDGLGYEDGIVISDRLVKEDVFLQFILKNMKQQLLKQN